jgi:LuxR family maltose regulon positive regulatory protein
LDRFCVPLCDALGESGRDPEPSGIDGKAFISYLQENNIFLIPLDLEDRWFRYHHLFQGLLRGQLGRQCSSEEIASFHGRASDWFADNGLIDEAIHHGIEAGNVAGTVEIIEKHRYDAMAKDQWSAITSWLNHLPDERLQESAGLLLTKAWVLESQFRISEIPAIIERVKFLLEKETAEHALMGELSFFEGHLRFWQGEIDRSVELFRKAQDLVPREEKYDLIRGDNELYCAMALQMTGQERIAIRELNEKIGSHRTRKGMYYTRLVSSPCFVYMLSGDLRQAEEAAVQLREASRKSGLAYADTWSDYFHGCCRFHVYDLDRALLHFAAATERKYIMHDAQALCSLAGLALTYQGLGRTEEANESLEELLAFAHENNESIRLPTAHSARARLSLLQGDLETAATWQRSFHGNFDVSSLLVWLEVPEVTRCRVLIAIGSEDGLNQAFQELETMVKLANEIHNTFHRIDLLALQALTLCKLSRMDESLEVLEQALSMAEPGGWIRPFVEPGPQMADLLSRLKQEKEDALFIDQVLAAFRADEDRAAPEATDLQAAPPSPTKAQPLIEPLTFREIETLDLLAQGLYNKEIADKLSISLETVKTHLKNIYQKLGVSSRQQAVHRARTLEILPRH